MGCTSECGSGYHDRCNLVWCDCGCHHALIDAHHAGAHTTCVRDCQECRRGSHQKVYSGEYFATLIPKWHWICADCKATGADSIPSETPPPLDMPRFLDLLADIDPAGAASMRLLLARASTRRTLAWAEGQRALRAWAASG